MIAEENQNVKLFGAQPRHTPGYGPSPHAPEEQAKMRGVPGLTNVDPCDSLDNEHAVEITPGVALLFYKGTATGKCGEMDIKPQWAATLYTKQGDTWRGAFFLATQA